MKSKIGLYRVVSIGFLVLLMLQILGCSDDSDNGGTDSDTDTDTDTDSDSDTDTDTDTDADTDTDTDTDSDPGMVLDCEVDSERVYDDVEYLASAKLEGRAPGTAGNEAALVHAETVFQKAGLAEGGDKGEGYRHLFDIIDWSMDEDPFLSVNGETFVEGSDYTVFGFSGSGDFTGEIVFAGYAIVIPPYEQSDYPDCPYDTNGYDDFEGLGDLSGKIALVLRHGPNDNDATNDGCPHIGSGNQYFSSKITRVHEKGASGMIMVHHFDDSGEVQDLSLGMSGYFEDVASVYADRDKIVSEIPDLETWANAIDSSYEPNAQATGVDAQMIISTTGVQIETANLIGVAPGTDPVIGDEVVLIGAHIDHLGVDGSTGDIYYGADDNASGSAVVLEMARMIDECELEPARTVLLALWNAEEMGLIGSYYYADNPTYPLEDFVAVINADMVGAGNGTGLNVSGAFEMVNRWIYDTMANSADYLGMDFNTQMAGSMSASDHYPFVVQGIPAVSVDTIGDHPYYHTPDDHIGNIQIENLNAAANLVLAAMAPIALGLEDYFSDPYKQSSTEFCPIAQHRPELERFR